MPEVKTEKPLRGETLRYTYPCMWSESAACDLAFCDLNDGRTAVRCIDRSTHRQTQVVMVLELLATRVCREFGIEPEQLVWVMGIGGGVAAAPTSHITGSPLWSMKPRAASAVRSGTTSRRLNSRLSALTPRPPTTRASRMPRQE